MSVSERLLITGSLDCLAWLLVLWGLGKAARRVGWARVFRGEISEADALFAQSKQLLFVVGQVNLLARFILSLDIALNSLSIT